MTPQEYSDRQAAITAGIAAVVVKFGRLFSMTPLSLDQWLGLLRFLFPQIENAREQSADLARRFYDSQREQAFPELDRNDQFLESYSFERFVADMEPARKPMQRSESGDDALGRVALQATRAVENAGRQQIIHAVEEDEELAELIEELEREANKPKPAPAREPEPGVPTRQDDIERMKERLAEEAGRLKGSRKYEKIRERIEAEKEDDTPTRGVVRGWARVATGRETCAFCLMLISRGPTYYGADTAGLDLDDASAAQAYAEAPSLEAFFEETKDYMEQWHPGCDCRVVPVFDRRNWVGKKAAGEALEAWKRASRIASDELEDSPVHRAGKKKGEPFTHNELALNALRRLLERGDISMSEFAALAA